MSEKVSQPGDLDKFVPTKKPLGDYPEKITFAAGEMPPMNPDATVNRKLLNIDPALIKYDPPNKAQLDLSAKELDDDATKFHQFLEENKKVVSQMPKWKQEAYKLTPDNVYNVEVNKDGFVIDGPHPPAMDRDVTQPTHYTAHPSGIECITIAQHFNFNVGNAVKYLWRAGLKVPKGVSETEAAVKDLKKAKEYIDFEIRRLTL
jgi:hypothetical protein